MNFEHLYYQKKLCFVHNMLCSDNSIIVTVMRLFMQSNEYVKLCQFADVTPHSNISSCQPEIYFSLCVGLTACTV